MIRHAAAFAATLALASAAAAGEPPASCALDRVTALTPEGPVDFTVEIADDAEERAQGLMFRQEMAEDAGMIFLYEDVAPRHFWMKNTFLPLDIIFFDAGGVIVHVAENTTPFSLKTISSVEPAMGALEVNGGVTEALGIGPGTVLIHPAFAGAASPEHRCPDS